MKTLPLAVFALSLSAASSFSMAATSCDRSSWNYLDSYDRYSGLPSKLENLSALLPSNLRNDILTMLPEQIDVRTKAVTKAMLTNDLGANIFLKKDATIKVAYLYSSTIMWNSLAFFKFPANQLDSLSESDIQDRIFFPNFNDNSYYNGPLTYGTAVNIGKFKAGEAIGFSIIHNFWDTNNAYGRRKLNDIYDIGRQYTTCKQVYRTIRRFNSEPNDSQNLNQHTLLFSDRAHGLLILGMENLHRSNDRFNDYGPWSPGFAHDFNDVVMAIHVDPYDAIIDDEIPDIKTGEKPKPSPTPTPPPPPPPSVGVSGNLNWREVTVGQEVQDPTIAAKAAAKIARDAAKAAEKSGKGKGNK